MEQDASFGSRAKWLRRLLQSNVLAMGCWEAGGKFSNVNDAFLKLIGYTRQELNEGKVVLFQLTPPEYSHLDEQALEEARVKGECTPYEKEIINKSGERVPVLVGGATFSRGDTDSGAFFAVDLRERKQAVIDQAAEIPPELLDFTDRQRTICLLLSYGEPDKRIARLLDVSLRTVELDKHRVAERVGMPTARVVVWSVENRKGLLATFKDRKLVPKAVNDIISQSCR
jgi:PAS domain S-box-containing protein